MAFDGGTDPTPHIAEQTGALSRIMPETEPLEEKPAASQLPNPAAWDADVKPPVSPNPPRAATSRPVDTAADAEVKSEGAVQPDVSNLPNAVPFEIPVLEGKHRSGHSASSQPVPIHIPRYLKSNRPVDWKHLPPSSINSRLIAEQQVESVNGLLSGGVNGFLPGGPLLSSVNGPLLPGANSPVLPGHLMAGVHSPTSPYTFKSFENRFPSSVNSPKDVSGVNRASAGEEPGTAALHPRGGVNSSKTEPVSSSGGSASQQAAGVNSPHKGHQRPILPAHSPGGSHGVGAHGMPYPPTMTHSQHPNVYTVAGSFPNRESLPLLL